MRLNSVLFFTVKTLLVLLKFIFIFHPERIFFELEITVYFFAFVKSCYISFSKKTPHYVTVSISYSQFGSQEEPLIVLKTSLKNYLCYGGWLRQAILLKQASSFKCVRKTVVLFDA